MSKEIEKLINRIGEKILNLQLEEFTISGDKEISNVWLKLSEGKPFVFGCAGDGSIYIRNRNRLNIPIKTKAIPLRTLQNLVIHY